MASSSSQVKADAQRSSISIAKTPMSIGKRKLHDTKSRNTDSESKRQKSPASESARSSPLSAVSGTLSDLTASSVFPRAYTKHSRFWVLDGNILLQIGMVRFKLHRSRLASQSPWFETLFIKHAGGTPAIKPGEDDDSAPIDDVMVETFESQDVFILDSTGVAVEDFETLLAAMDDGIDFYFADPGFRTVARILRAASAFQFRKLFKFAKAYVEDTFADDVEEVTEDRLEHATEALILGRDWGVPSILKRAFYELARHDDGNVDADAVDDDGVCGDEEEEEMDGCDDENDGGSAGGAKEEDNTAKVDVEGGRGEKGEEEGPQDDEDELPIDHLDPHDLILLMRGQKRLADAWMSALDMEPIASCKTSCKGSRADVSRGLFQPATSTSSGEKPIIQTYQFDPLCGLSKLIEGNWQALKYCADCAQVRKQAMERAREEIWEAMDDWFELV